jgi:hypothetical protein
MRLYRKTGIRSKEEARQACELASGAHINTIKQSRLFFWERVFHFVRSLTLVLSLSKG